MDKLTKKYEIKSFECDLNKNLKLQTLFHFFQDVADIHATNLGFGYDYCISNDIFWVGTNYEIEILKMPKWKDIIEVRTWPSEKSKIFGIRDFEVFVNGENYINASSRWVLLNKDSLRPQSIQKYAYHEPLLVHALSSDFSKIEIPDNFDSETFFKAHFSDIDINNHVNNTTYPMWAENAIDVNFRLNHEISKIKVEFKKSSYINDGIVVKTKMNDDTSIQVIKSDKDDTIFSNIEIKWTKKAD